MRVGQGKELSLPLIFWLWSIRENEHLSGDFFSKPTTQMGLERSLSDERSAQTTMVESGHPRRELYEPHCSCRDIFKLLLLLLNFKPVNKGQMVQWKKCHQKVHKTFPLHVFTEKFDSASFLNFEYYIQDGKHCRKCLILKTHYYRICDFDKSNIKIKLLLV